jgi:pyruvate dehydrogenase E2 component (dihydrolipoamide acetyltransferase)
VAPYTGVRKIIGERLAESKFTAPHLYFTQKVDMAALLSLRKIVNEKRERKTSVTDYIAWACVIALGKYPDMNSSLVGDRIETYASVNLGVAVASPTGLIVPVVKNAQELSVVEFSEAASELFEKARERKLKQEEYSDGTFTISNLGMFGIENFTAIINPPEVGILAISSTKDEPVVVTGEGGEKTVAIRPMMNITLSVDHRLIDGLLAAQFVTEVKRLLESPIELLI